MEPREEPLARGGGRGRCDLEGGALGGPLERGKGGGRKSEGMLATEGRGAGGEGDTWKIRSMGDPAALREVGMRRHGG